MNIRGAATFLAVTILTLSCPLFGDKLHRNVDESSIDIEFHDVTSSRIYISWKEWIKSVCNSTTISSFEITIVNEKGGHISSYLNRANNTSRRFEELEADTEYSFIVRAILRTPFHDDSGVERLFFVTQASKRTLCTDPPSPSLDVSSFSSTKANLHYKTYDWSCSKSVTVLQRKMGSGVWETVLNELNTTSFSVQLIPCSVNMFRIQHLSPNGSELLLDSSIVAIRTPNKRGGRCRTESHRKDITGVFVGVGVVFCIITFYSLAYCHWRCSGGHIAPQDKTDSGILVPTEREEASKDNEQNEDQIDSSVVNTSYVEDQV